MKKEEAVLLDDCLYDITNASGSIDAEMSKLSTSIQVTDDSRARAHTHTHKHIRTNMNAHTHTTHTYTYTYTCVHTCIPQRLQHITDKMELSGKRPTPIQQRQAVLAASELKKNIQDLKSHVASEAVCYGVGRVDTHTQMHAHSNTHIHTHVHVHVHVHTHPLVAIFL